MIVHKTQEILLLDSSINLSREYRKQVIEKRRARRGAENAEKLRQMCCVLICVICVIGGYSYDRNCFRKKVAIFQASIAFHGISAVV